MIVSFIKNPGKGRGFYLHQEGFALHYFRITFQMIVLHNMEAGSFTSIKVRRQKPIHDTKCTPAEHFTRE